jgi:hypothetical protein
MNMSITDHPLVIGMNLFPELTQLDLTGPYEVFARMPRTTVHLLAETLQPVRSERGLTITPDATWATSPPLDPFLVHQLRAARQPIQSGRRAIADRIAQQNRGLDPWLPL